LEHLFNNNLFERKNFFSTINYIEAKSVIDLLADLKPSPSINKNILIKDISSKSLIRKNSIIFLDKLYSNSIKEDLLVISNIDQKNNIDYIKVNNISQAYNKILNFMFPHEDIHADNFDNYNYLNGSYISKYSKIDDSVEIGSNCFIGRGVEIKKNTIIKNNVVIKNSIIEKNVTICDNSTIGSTGFGFNLNCMGSKHVNPHIGTVILKENVYIGANCTIDRGKIDFTFIGKNSMLDNLIHIAHNVIIGENVCIAAQTGISGSSIIGNNVVIGGQVGIAGHIKIGDKCIIAARSGVTKSIPDNSKVAGFPAIDIKKWKKFIINQRVSIK